uniref:RING-type domain-containing protein n=1 Tax=Globodera rostochiensis TaxID=31243 RepID=A0A914ID78_GLORO
MRRSVVVALYKPNFSKRYTVNLGSMESSEIYWHRRIFMERKSGDILPGNFHAFLYAYARKNRPENVNLYEMPEQQKLLGYAPMVLNTLGNMPSTADNAIQRQRISEYRLSIPIDLKSLFKHKILSLGLYVFQFNESDLKENDVEINKNSNESDQLSWPPPDSVGQTQSARLSWPRLSRPDSVVPYRKKVHAFHSDCIKKWIEILEKIRCPLCNKEPELKIVGECLPIFSGPSEVPPLGVYANPLAELCRRAQNAADGTFIKAQSQFALDSIVRRLSKAETAVRHLLANDLHFLLLVGDDQPLFSIGSEGFVENGEFLQNIRKALENPQKILQKHREKFHKALALIQWAKIFQSSEANDALESMQLISEET